MSNDPPLPWLRNRSANRSIPDSEAEICVNCWHFYDVSGIVLRLAGKAYALSGTDEEKLGLLKALAATDYLTAIQARVPAKFILSNGANEIEGAIPAASLQMDPIPVYDELFEQIAAALPQVVRELDGDYVLSKAELKEPFLWVSTAVFEQPDGSLIAKIN